MYPATHKLPYRDACIQSLNVQRLDLIVALGSLPDRVLHDLQYDWCKLIHGLCGEEWIDHLTSDAMIVHVDQGRERFGNAARCLEEFRVFHELGTRGINPAQPFSLAEELAGKESPPTHGKIQDRPHGHDPG
jgi:hypothetical protein